MNIMMRTVSGLILASLFALLSSEARAQSVVGITAMTITTETVDCYFATAIDAELNFYYDPYVDGYLFKQPAGGGFQLIRSGSAYGGSEGDIADGYMSAPTEFNTLFQAEGDHYLVSFFYEPVLALWYNPYGYGFASTEDPPWPSGEPFPSGLAPIYREPQFQFLGTTVVAIFVPPPTVSLTATGSRELGKSTHYISLTNTGNVTITATLNPPNADPNLITWTGGSPGSNNLTRVISTSGASDTTVTASVASSNSASVVIHVVDATPPPPAAVDSARSFSFAGTIIPTADKFGQTVFLDTSLGVGYPTYTINAHLSNDRWFFRVRDIQHSYKKGTKDRMRTDLPNGNPPVFPPPLLAPTMTLEQSHTEARIDFDTTGLADMGGGPRRMYYWVKTIAELHEDFHVTDFYTVYWLAAMGLFESNDVESSTQYIIFDCNNPQTTTAPAVVDSRKNTFLSDMRTRFDKALNDDFAPGMEVRAHNFSNPLYVPIRAQIPIP
jgi:hypothetical protein